MGDSEPGREAPGRGVSAQAGPPTLFTCRWHPHALQARFYPSMPSWAQVTSWGDSCPGPVGGQLPGKSPGLGTALRTSRPSLEWRAWGPSSVHFPSDPTVLK